MKTVNRGIWNAVVNDYAIPTKFVENKTIEKPYKSWSQEEIRRVEYDSKVMNIIHSSLQCDEFFRVSTCTTTKELWNLIQVTHEGTSCWIEWPQNTLEGGVELIIPKPLLIKKLLF